MEYEDKFKQMVDRLNIDNKPAVGHKEQLRKQMLEAYGQSKMPQHRIRPIWSTIMKSNVTKTAAAAIIAVAAFIFLTQTNGTELVLADVVKNFSRPYQCTQTVYYGGKEGHKLTLYRLNLSQRREERANNEVFIVDMSKSPVETLYLYTDQKFAKLTRDFNVGPQEDPDMLRMLSNMSAGNAEKLGTQTIGGAQAEGFRTVSKYNDITIWGDVKTGLPVRVEVIHPQQDRKLVFEDFVFDVQLDPTLFSTNPPEGFRVEEKVMDAKVQEVPKEQVSQKKAGYPVYGLKGALSWTMEPTMMEANVPGAPKKKVHVIAATSKDGRHVAIAQSVVYKSLKSQIQGGNKCLELNGFVAYNGGPEKWYSHTTLKSAEGMIPPEISEDRTGYGIITPKDTVIIVGINGAITAEELKELVEGLELCESK